MGVISDCEASLGEVGDGLGGYWEWFPEGRLLGAASGQEAVDQEHDNGAADGHREASDVELGYEWLTRQSRIEEPADERSKDAEEHRDYAAAGVPARSEQFGDDSGYQTEEDPEQYIHRFLREVGYRTPPILPADAGTA